MKKLHFYHVSSVDELAQPQETNQITLDSPALTFLTDFSVTEPLMIDSSASAIEAKELMQKTHVRLQMVVDENNHFVGVVSADDLIDRKLVMKVSEGNPRNEIPITEMMKPKESLMALDIEELSRANIRDVINALRDSGQQHALVISRDNHKIRGIFSASDISRKLHLPIDIQRRSTFFDVFMAINSKHVSPLAVAS